MKWINLTPHTLHIQKANGETVEIPPSGTVARVGETRTVLGEVGGFVVEIVEYNHFVTGLPEPEIGTRFITSLLTLREAHGRTDVFAPGELIRDDNGDIIAARGLTQTMKQAAEYVGGFLKVYPKEDLG